MTYIVKGLQYVKSLHFLPRVDANRLVLEGNYEGYWEVNFLDIMKGLEIQHALYRAHPVCLRSPGLI